MVNRWRLLPLVAVVGLSACATIPTGPSVMVLPGQGQPFEQFQTDDAVCWQWASAQAGTTPGQASTEAAVSSAALGTVLGAGLGAAIGAGSGALGGTCVGMGASQAAAGTVQWRYDIVYEQCMYAKGAPDPGGHAAPATALHGTASTATSARRKQRAVVASPAATTVRSDGGRAAQEFECGSETQICRANPSSAGRSSAGRA
jgi:hypothetical protein